MNLISTNDCSPSGQLLKKIKTLLLLAVFTVSSFNVFAQTTSLISACGDFVAGPNTTWTNVLVATTVADGAASQGAQTFTMNVTTLPSGGANVRVFKTTANGSSFFGPAQALTLGSNSITVAAVGFDRAVKFQFSDGAVEFDALSLNGVASTCVAPTPLPSTSLISACGDFVAGPSAWPHVLVATTVADGATSQGAQTFTMNVTTLPSGGANVRVYKTNAQGNDYFGPAQALTLGPNSITVAAVGFDRAVKFQFSDGAVEFDALSLNGVASTCVAPTPLPSTSLISACGDFVAGPNATWTHVLVATTVADGAASQGAQTFSMNVTTLPSGGANVRVYKTNALGNDYFGPAQALTLGSNSITVAAVGFDRAVKFQFSDGAVEFDALSLNGVASTCVAPTPLPSTSLISACGDFVAGPNATWTHVLVATTVADGAASQGAQTFSMNVTTLPSGGANYRVIKTTANGNWFNGPAQALTLGPNSVTVAAVGFDRSVKFQFSDGAVEFDALSLNGVASTCLGTATPVSGCTDPLATNYDATATVDDGSCVYPIPGCTDPLASNYNASATVDDGSCSYLVQCCNSSSYGSAIAPTSGVVQISSCNYLSEYSTISSVAAATVYGLNVTGVNANPGWITVYEGSTCGNIVAEGSAPLTFTSLGAGTYYVHWGVDNSCATASGCHTTSMAYGGFVNGCTDPIASNYDPSANVDDGSCTYVLGCTDPLATNYDPSATQDDGSCTYPSCLAVAPYSEDFSAGVLPAGTCPASWSISATTGDGWRFTGSPGYAAGSNGRASGTYAWIDFSSTDVGVVMQVEDVDVSGLSSPAMTFAYFSDAGTYTLATANTMYVEAFDGSAWNVIGTFDQFTSGWETKLVDLAGADVAGTVSLRFRAESSGLSSDFYNDLLVDDLSVDEMPAAGCTDPIATNYDSTVTIDDGSCQYIMGCMTATACNYDALATMDDGSCTYPGCTDSTANNYDASAGCDDGSCQYACTAAPYAENFDAGMGTWTTANIGTGSYIGWYSGTSTPSSGTGPQAGDVTGGNFMYIETSGTGGPYTLTSECLDISALAAPALRFHYHMYGSTMGTLDVSVNGTSVWSMSGDQGNAWTPAQIDLSAYAGVDITIVFTGTRGTSFTGDMAIDAIEVDEMVSLTIPGCTDPLALNYNAMANSDDGSCNYNCVNSSSYGSATADPYGAVTVSTCNYLSEYSTISGVGAGESYTASISGVNANPGYIVVYEGGVSTNFVAQGYAPLTWTSTVAGTYYIHWMVDSVCATASGCHTTTLTGNNVPPVIDCNGVTNGTSVLDTCGVCQSAYIYNFITHVPTFVTNANILVPGLDYNPSQEMVVLPGDPGDPNWNSSCSGCTDATAFNYDPSAIIDDGSCSYPPIPGCTDPLACNYDPIATVDDGSCLTVYGCTDATAFNYDPLAGCDDGSCVPVQLGCLDTNAVNYNPGANTDDGSCIYSGCTDPLASNYNASATIDDGSCSYPLTVTTTVCNSATSVRMTGPWWNWDPNGGPVAVDNGNGTWTFTFDPAPTADMEYLLVVDGVQEDLVAANTASGDWSCTPITDYWSYANRLWTVGSGNVTNTYGTCGVCVTTVSGCTDSTATNYDPTATVDDGSCQYPPVVCAEDAPTNLSATNVIQNRATINWDNMNSSVCLVDQYRIKFRPVGSSTWTQKTMGQPVGSCLWACNKVEKLILNLIPNTTYEYQMKAWYCGGGASAWTSLHTFTTAPDCPNVGNFAVTTPTTTKATFTGMIQMERIVS